MDIYGRAFWCPKSGCPDEEYEDAFAPEELDTGEGLFAKGRRQFRVAVADGVTDAVFSRLWARQLTSAYCTRGLSRKNVHARIAQLHAIWERESVRKPLPWYAEEKQRAGAFATFLGLMLKGEPDSMIGGRWDAWAIGDCCLFQVRGEEVICKFPMSESSAFTNHPDLIPSHPNRLVGLEKKIIKCGGYWKPDDRFYLMTDALAAWFLQEVELGEAPWRTLRDLGTEDGVTDFRTWVEELRATGRLKDDDVTLVRVDPV
jgi:hypothetical protein